MSTIVEHIAGKEYEYLRKEHADAIQETRTIERQAILASGAVWTWLLTQTPTNFATHLYIAITPYLPLIICLLGALRSFGLFVRLDRIGRYTVAIEAHLKESPFIGWETHLSEKHWLLTATSVIFWLFIIGLNCYAVYIYK